MLSSLTKLTCHNINIDSLPVLPNLNTLILHYYNNLNSLPVLPNLTYLDLYICASLSRLPILPMLNSLNIMSCQNVDKYTIPLELFPFEPYWNYYNLDEYINYNEKI